MALNIKPLFPLDHPEVTSTKSDYKTRKTDGEKGNRYSKENFNPPPNEEVQKYLEYFEPDFQKKKLDII